MFHPDFVLDAPTGSSLLAELCIDPATVRELIEHDRAIRCPERGAVFSERRTGDRSSSSSSLRSAVER